MLGELPLFDMTGATVVEAPEDHLVNELTVLPRLMLPAPALVIEVRGTPGPQGSKSHKGGGRIGKKNARTSRSGRSSQRLAPPHG